MIVHSLFLRLAAVSAFGLILGMALGLACGATARSIEADAKSAVVNCTAQQLGATPALDLATLVAVANTVAAERAKCTPPGGPLDWKCVETDLLAQGKVLGGCALVTMVTDAVPPRSASGLTAAAPPSRPELVDFCARAAPGTTYHLSTGNSPCP